MAASYDEELLLTAIRLLDRRRGQRGRLPSAWIMRSISTSYHALFHFLLDEATTRVVGTGSILRVRRRALARAVTHRGLRLTLVKVRGGRTDSSVEVIFERAGSATSTAPRFAREAASVFLDAQTRRELADYDLNAPMSESDARFLHSRVSRAIADWRGATSRADNDFKHALAILILLKGQLRSDA